LQVLLVCRSACRMLWSNRYFTYVLESTLSKSRQMARRAALSASLVLGLLIGGISAEAADEQWVRMSPHDFRDKSSCAVCHVAGTPELLADNVTTCTKCHPGNVGHHPVVRHPMGKRPGRLLPVSLPVSENGLMVCSTCHDQHNKTRNRKMLRVSALKLCGSCHKGY
jgi:predicted CXXCH cytochrome family protein